MDITVYTKPDCQQCSATYRALDKRGLSYRTVDITEDAQAREYVKGLGYLRAPVVVAGEQHWSGFRPDRVKALPPPAPDVPTQGEDQVAEDDRHVTIGGLTIPAYERPDVKAVERWASPFLRSASNLGEIPAVGSAAWVALPGNDPRKTGAVVQAAVKEARAVANIEDRAKLDLDLARDSALAAQKQASLDVGEAMQELEIRPGPSHAELQRRRYGDQAEEVTRRQADDNRSHGGRRAPWDAARGPLTAPTGAQSAPAASAPTARPPTSYAENQIRNPRKGLAR